MTTWRVVIDFRKLNEWTVGDAYPLPNITEILGQVEKALYNSTIGLVSEYYETQLADKDGCKTAFRSPKGHFQFLRLPMGLKSSPATFQPLMNSVLAGVNGLRSFCYMDDVMITAKLLESHSDRLRVLFQRLRESNLKTEPFKCEFLRAEVQFLGHRVSDKDLLPDPKKKEVVRNIPEPKTVKKLRGSLGLSSYYRRFIQNYSKVAKPLYHLLKKECVS
jgi:hypothetical protein